MTREEFRDNVSVGTIVVYTTVQRGGHEHEGIAAVWKTGEVKFLKGTSSARVQHEDGSNAFIHYTRVLGVVDSHQSDEPGYDLDRDEWLSPSYYDERDARR
jgi:hypothetical protein